ncbi:hypothetical protein EWF20_10490 [Sulfolobus sp. S-194]|uniref:hypothetical protein n=1 Tax=Sulfolobus sp. S-194 TaxID=2512240 RepID=UPI001437231B|nr:hypothetical protein [Sulfolobus sp. S-194]QIW24523.1 hypothetical protein EWF20_10490 [Sulfolobus sp. S-194]
MKSDVIIGTLSFIVIMLLLIFYFYCLKSLIGTYGYLQNSILKYILPQLAKLNNNTNLLAVNNTTFQIIYYNASEEELFTVIKNTNTLMHKVALASLSLIVTIVFYVLYIFLFYRYFYNKKINNINRILNFVYYVIIPIFIELAISFATSLLAAMFNSSLYPILLTFISVMMRLIPINSTYSLIDSLIFGLDIFLFVIGFLIEHISDHQLETNYDFKGIKGIFLDYNNKFLKLINDIIVLLIKILIILGFVFSIIISFSAYYNIAFLLEDLLFIINFMQIVSILALFSFSLDFLISLSFRIIS